MRLILFGEVLRSLNRLLKIREGNSLENSLIDEY